jgi:hypothetical protein
MTTSACIIRLISGADCSVAKFEVLLNFLLKVMIMDGEMGKDVDGNCCCLVWCNDETFTGIRRRNPRNVMYSSPRDRAIVSQYMLCADDDLQWWPHGICQHKFV